MFDIGWGELVVIGIVALIAIGPKELPTVLRTLGQYMAKVRRMASEFQGQFQEAMREAEVADLKKQAEDLTGSLTDVTNFDPMASAQKEMASAFEMPEPAKSESDKAETDKAETDKSETDKTESDKAESDKTEPAKPDAAEAASPAPVASSEAAPPLPEIDVPLPELPAPVTEKDFAPSEPPPPPKKRTKRAGGGA
jgi:sec-independent protein translocase protein TatB